MKLLLQRVSSASVLVDNECVGAINRGLLVLMGVDQGDDDAVMQRLLDKMLAYRVFSDEQGKMNLNVTQAGGGVLLVSQFTLSADTSKGLRPSFSSAAAPDHARTIYDKACDYVRPRVETFGQGIFAADMQVMLCNDGPVTFLLES